MESNKHSLGSLENENGVGVGDGTGVPNDNISSCSINDRAYLSSSLSSIVRIFHWGPMVALFIIAWISIVGFFCLLQWWPPLKTWGGMVNATIYLTWDVIILYNMIGACLIGPGFVPYGWMPKTKEDCKYLQYCKFCEGYKAPRSHHCRKCNRCVMKMDHHCPWINTCCGHLNHAKFTYFLIFAPLGCIHATIVLIASVYRAIYRPYYQYYGDGTEPIVELGLKSFLCCVFGIGLALGTTIAVGMLFVVQFKSILRNETGIESWIIDKAKHRDKAPDETPFVYPYNLGRKKNLREVFTWSGIPISNGTEWEVIEGCNQYTLTIEQMKQKEEKRDRTIPYAITEDYSGAICPITKGCYVCCDTPCTDEPRIKLLKGDKVLVTRWKKHWMYGDKVIKGEDPTSKTRVRGWFPKKIARHELQDGSMIGVKHIIHPVSKKKD